VPPSKRRLAITASSHFAAQYIRMSTDKQDLSPSVQKEPIAAYAAARGMEIVATHEDEGRSGIHLKNRPPQQSCPCSMARDDLRWHWIQMMDSHQLRDNKDIRFVGAIYPPFSGGWRRRLPP